MSSVAKCHIQSQGRKKHQPEDNQQYVPPVAEIQGKVGERSRPFTPGDSRVGGPTQGQRGTGRLGLLGVSALKFSS